MRRRKSSLKRKLLVLVPSILAIAVLGSFVFGSSSAKEDDPITELGSMNVVPHLFYGKNVEGLTILCRKIKPNEFFADLLMSEGVPYNKVHRLVQNCADIFDVRTLREGKKVSFIKKDTITQMLIYDPYPYYYYEFDIESGSVIKIERPVTTVISKATGSIKSSMWNAIIEAGLNPGVASIMEDAFAWSVDMYHVQKGDKFSLIFEEEIINGEKVNYGKLIAGHFISSGTDHYAFKFDSGKHYGYFDLDGRPMRKAFLKSPVKYGRISSGFNTRRFHPILKRVKPHFGTDYAAARGTPIQAVAAGIITKASYTRGNGKYVKMRHDKIYETQYLHMSGFAKSIKPGVHVKQGQTIGYVGSTGLATGPHVCFRFWKNGRQVNHLKEKLPPPEPMPKELLPSYYKLRDSLKSQIDLLEGEDFKENKIQENVDSLKSV